MRVQIETVTPEKAQKWLQKVEKKDISRRSRSRVKKYADAMRAGHWKMTHQGLTFDRNDVLLDGRLRLFAIIESETNIKMAVCRMEQSKDELERLFSWEGICKNATA